FKPILPLLGTLAESISDRPSAFQQISLLKHIQHRIRGRARNRITGERPSQSTRARSIHNLGAPGNRRQRQPAPQRLCSHNNVRLDPVMLARENLARPSKSALYFIRDEQPTVLAANLHHDRKEFGWWGYKAAFSQPRPGDHRRNVLRSHHALER